jgi:4-hydroxybenzoyl-CoA reductase alpha subunit
MQQYSVVGKSIPNIDSVSKVTGRALYTGDLKMPGLLVGKILRSPYAHARILNINTSKAARLLGVKTIITGKDTLGIKYGMWRVRRELLDEEGLATEKVRFIGDAVAAVAALDEDSALEAVDLIEVEYEPLPAVFTLEDAMKEDAPLVHEGYKKNVNVIRTIDIGDVEKGFRESDYVREDSFVTQSVQHCSLEPHVCVASFDPMGKLTLWDSTQSPYFVQVNLATTLGLRENDVRIIKGHVGGGFGNKVEFFSNEFCASLLSRKTGRPVRIEYTRKEEFTVTRRRVPEMIKMKTGVKKDGTIVARESTIILDGGAYTGQVPTTTMLSGMLGLLPYRISNYRYSGQRVYTNNMPSGAMRGHGALQPNFASEVQLDLIADELGIDPVDLRLKNAMQAGDGVPGIAPRIESCGLIECITKIAEATDWRRKRKDLPKGRGIGIACYAFTAGGIFNWFGTTLPFSEALVKLNEDGTAILYSRAADIGQGVNTICSQILAEELGIRMEDVKIIAGDTDTSTADLGAWSSRLTLHMGNAVRRAALDAKRQVFEIAGGILGVRVIEELEAKEGKIYIMQRPDKALFFAEAVGAAQMARGGSPIMGRGAYTPRGKGLVSSAWSFGAQAAEIQVDDETGNIRVVKLATAHDCGTAINPLLVDGQLEGSAQMGLGQALSEELIFQEGRVLNPSFRDYKLFTAADMPEVQSIVVETYEPEGPFGAKEAGEGLAIPTGAAVANAAHHATGTAFKKLPLTPERVLEGKADKGH